MKQVRIGVIAAAGKGTRAYPRTTYIPKPLFEIEGKTILHWNVELLKEKFQIEKIYVLVGHLKEIVVTEIEALKLRLKTGPELIPALWTTKGLASDVASLRDRISEPFILILGDEFYYKSTHENFLNTFKKHPKLAASIGVQKTKLPSRIRKNYSVEMKKDKITHLVEKPTNPPNDFLGLGSYLFTDEYFRFFDMTPISERSGVIEITDVIDKMAKESTGGVYATLMECEYFNINSMQDYHHAIYEIRNDNFTRFRKTLIIPTYNNEYSISEVLADFKGQADDILVIDAGSSDKTVELAKKEGVRVIQISDEILQVSPGESFGTQVQYGIQHAKGDILIVVSPDGAFRSKDFPKLLEYLKDSDMVIGTRTTRQMIEQGSNLKPLSRLINLIMGKLVEVFWWEQEPRFTDADCHYFGIWKESFLKIQENLWEKGRFFIVELMIETVRSHMRCIEIPISYYRPFQEEEYSLKKSIYYAWYILKLIFVKKFRSKI